MKRSKLETYVDILAVLSSDDPLKITHLMYKTNVNCSILKGYIDFLIKQGLVEKRTSPNQKTVFSATQRGLTVLKYFRELEQILPIVEANKN